MSQRYVRVYVMQPPAPGAEWSVRVDAEKAARFSHERDALSYAVRQARACRDEGASVELRIEDDHGLWRSMEL
ncbi:MAG TPA: hypothetical protein VN813_01495 [Luteibacter sp.]|jgi:hypothetical protein|nr:hypothetical protein [Luteibacter sp.]